MAKNYYAVKEGHRPGIYRTWDECKEQVSGFSNASYKGFATLAEAETFLSIEGVQTEISDYMQTDCTSEKHKSENSTSENRNSKNNNKETSVAEDKEDIPKIATRDEAVAYVDGSYNDSQKEFSYGLVMFTLGSEDVIEEHFAEKDDTPELVEMRNVAGEIMGAEKAMQYCVEKSIKSLDLYYDYEGIEKWCTGAWKTNKLGTQEYKRFYNSIKSKLQVNFYKVAAHTGDTYNELADKLAKGALKSEKSIKE